MSIAPPAPSSRARVRIRFSGALADLGAADRRALLERSTSRDDVVRERTARIIDRVRAGGDAALRQLARELDDATLEMLEVPRARCAAALDALEPSLRRAMERALSNIMTVHRVMLPAPLRVSPEPGIMIERRAEPLGRVGVYAPGGRASYPSSVLMGVAPARVAAVGEVILCSPPSADGAPAAPVLAAAALAGVDRVFAIGGAGAIAAMALGTESVPRVDRIVGPGNAYVAEAKLQLSGIVGIDSPAGPSEILVLADATSDMDAVAREMIAQAEHDPLACVVAVVIGDADAADALGAALDTEARRAARREIVLAALAAQGAILRAADVEGALAFAAAYAPEHLVIAFGDAEACERAAGRARNAGTIFVGASSSNAFGDYLTGANHVLPTGGLARSYAGLSVLDFVRWTTIQRVDRGAAARLADDVACFADAEGLPGHAAAAIAWRDEDAAAGGSLRRNVVAVRPEIAALPLYRPSATTSACDVDLSDNTNLWGMPPAARRTVEGIAESAARYPTAYSQTLKSALATHLGVDAAALVTGCGSDDVIDAAMRLVAAPGARVAYAAPTFSMVPVFARINGLTPVAVPLRDAEHGYDADAEALLATDAALIYLCTPNNPTGTTLSRATIDRVVDGATGIVLIDEAYAEFAGVSHINLAVSSDRVLVVRTFSKAFGLAGLRVGYGVASPELAALVERARGPYKVNVAAERAATAALASGSDALDWVEEHARRAVEIRERFAEAIRALGLEPLPSASNFVLVPVRGAAAVAAAMMGDGVRVRAMTDLGSDLAALAATDGNALRIGIGPWRAMERAVEALRRHAVIR